MSIGDNIKRKRLEKGYTLEELAHQIKTSKQTIHRYENGIISNIPSDKIEAIATALDTTPSYLMGWDEKVEKLFNGAIDFLEKDIELHKAIKERYGEDILYIIGKYDASDENQKTSMYIFSDESEHFKNLFLKYSRLDERAKKMVENLILSEYDSLYKKADKDTP